jgi:hypothetical protein
MNSIPARSKIILLPLHGMVDEAELIIIGKVLQIEKTSNTHKEYGYEYKVKIEVGETIKGNPLIRDVDIYYFPTFSIEPEFSLNERGIFFIKIWEKKYTVVQGYAGKVAIENENVKPLYIKDEESIQNLQIFIQKIRKFIK